MSVLAACMSCLSILWNPLLGHPLYWNSRRNFFIPRLFYFGPPCT